MCQTTRQIEFQLQRKLCLRSLATISMLTGMAHSPRDDEYFSGTIGCLHLKVKVELTVELHSFSF